MSRRPTVAITSVRGGDAPSAGLVVAQTLARQRAIDVDIAILVTDPLVEGVQAIHVADRIITVPPLDREPNAFVSRLADLGRTTAPLVLVPGRTADVLALVPHEAALRRAGVRAVLPRAARLAQLPSPRVPGVRRITTPERRPAGTVLAAASVAARTTPSALAVARLLDVSPGGVVWSAVTEAEPSMVAAVTRVVNRLRWRGPAETRFVLDERGRLWFTGLTPGFPSWISLAAAAGQDVALAYVRLALGRAAGRAGRFTGGLGLSRVAVDRVTTIDTLHQLVAEGDIVHVTRQR